MTPGRPASCLLASCLGTASHVVPIERIRSGAMPTMLRQVDFDFGQSRDFARAAYVSVAVSNPEFPKMEN